jgi:hypothetical protein
MTMSTRLTTIKRIQEIYEKLEKESLVSEELEELVKLSSEMYEKALILRFKAAEERVFEGKKVPTVAVAEDIVIIQTPHVEPTVDPVQMEHDVASPPVLDFDIFEPMNHAKPEEKVEEPEEEPQAEKMPDSVEEVLEPEVQKEAEPVQEIKEEMAPPPTSASDDLPAEWASFFKKVFDEHSSGIQTRLNALSGSFGLNERLLYINELFDGNAELFSDAIRHLDALNDWNACATELSVMGTQRSWDKTNDVTGEFILHVRRKHV